MLKPHIRGLEVSSFNSIPKPHSFFHTNNTFSSSFCDYGASTEYIDIKIYSMKEAYYQSGMLYPC